MLGGININIMIMMVVSSYSRVDFGWFRELEAFALSVQEDLRENPKSADRINNSLGIEVQDISSMKLVIMWA